MNTIVFFFLLFFSFNLTAQHEQVYEGPLGDEWAVQSQITIPEGKIIKLKSPVSIVADKLIIAGELVTDGNILNIEAREIEFKAGGKITGFNTTPSPISFVDNTLINITHNNTCSWNGTDDWAIGRNGPTGLPGINGNPSPGKISLLAGLLSGEININADGQQGGQGGKGGHGGKGVNGCKGSPGKAEAFCIGKPNLQHAGIGGNGAMGGLGGIGGTGGTGGTNISLEIVQLKQQIPDHWKTTNEGGKGGLGGAPGDNGLPGDRGPGGDGHRDEIECVVQAYPIKVTKKKSAEVSRGIDGGQILRSESKESRDKRNGNSGQFFSVTEDKRNFTSSVLIYEEQFKVTNAAYEFHWRRLFNLLLNDSLRIALNTSKNREAFSKLDNAELKKHLKQVNLNSLEKITQYWQEFFIDRQTIQLNSNNLTREQKLSIEKRLELAKTMAYIHQQLSSDQANLGTISFSTFALSKTNLQHICVWDLVSSG